MEIRDKLLIIGAGGHGRVVADIALKMNQWKQINFLDDDIKLNPFVGIDVIGTSSEALQFVKDYNIFVAVGNNKIREKIVFQLENAGASIPILIHPSAIIGVQVDIGAGSVIMAGTVINCCCNIGKGVIVNTGATVDHGNVIEDYVHISPGVHTAGTVEIGKYSWIGIGATISNNLKICDESIVGAGAVIISDIIIPGTYIGVPARRICTDDPNTGIGK
ncbi:MAG: sugar O-acyltransferase, sialic acid O-acetyltransferase NeuD family protein [Herbinix sp.]|jgi:sugar O-acyltransferase (sialic acid O-acetyltransferase NeuD family)|nr:sugar O-acyltransferase, sialic acid O-acetyltransferase NeuD family protein [Herbinix sp.]